MKLLIGYVLFIFIRKNFETPRFLYTELSRNIPNTGIFKNQLYLASLVCNDKSEIESISKKCKMIDRTFSSVYYLFIIFGSFF